MSENDRWEWHVAPSLGVMLQHDWRVTKLERSKIGTYVVQAVREHWMLELASVDGMDDCGTLINLSTGDQLRLDRDWRVRAYAAKTNEELAQEMAKAADGGTLVVAKPTNEVAELADKAPYMTAPVWRLLDGLNEKTKRVLAVAGITSMGQLAHRSDQQLLAIRHFDQECLDDLLANLRKMVEESR
ncbi:hypothetical protein [Microbispora sp. NPDC049633]|uniref:hypothetical protein n=1 Tax=Microbispora sp. NPDC049633 TaxID=3154355 RepID=UPI00343B5252